MGALTARRKFVVVHPPVLSSVPVGQRHQGGKKSALRGGGGVTRRPIFPTPCPPSLAAVTGEGGFRAGVPNLPVRGGGRGSTQHLWLKMIPTSR